MSLASASSTSFVQPTALPTFGSIYTSNYAAFERNNATYIFTPDTFTLDPTLGFQTASLYVYAENVILGGNYSDRFASKTLGLYCDTLTLAGNVTIDVSGKPGPSGLPYAGKGGPDVDGKPGDPGGVIDLFVQNNLESQLGRLTLIANGGTGGHGGDSSSDSPIAVSRGGDGGPGGKITIQYGSVATRLSMILSQALKRSWYEGSALVQNSMTSNLQAWSDMGVNTTETLAIIKNFKAQDTALTNLRLALTTAVTDNLNQGVVKQAKVLVDKLQQLALAADPPILSAATTKAANALTNLVTKYNNFDSDVVPTLIQRMKDFKIPQSKDKTLRTAVEDLMLTLTGARQDMLGKVKRMAISNGGKPGRNGYAAVTTSPPDKKASRGRDATPLVHGLIFDGRKADVAFQSPYMLPDQIQMVLDRANDLYFTNETSNIAEAQGIYLRLVERLSGVDALGTSSGMDIAFARLDKLSLASASTLKWQQKQARLSCAQILTGKDMFGHDAAWVPRLSYTFYSDKARELINGIVDYENQFQDYVKKLDNQAEAATLIASISADLSRGAAEAAMRMKYYGGDNGPMAAAAERVDSLTPLLVRKHRHVLALMPNLINKINSQTNFNWGTMLESLGGFAFGGLNGVAQLSNSAYKFTTQIRDRDGGWVDKSKVVDDIQEAGKDLVSVANAWSTRKDGSISVDEVRSKKLLASQQQIHDIIKQFKAGIPEGVGEGFNQALDDYVDTAIQRNNAALEYNSVLHLWLQASADLDYYNAAKDKAGQSQLSADPTLPSVVNWFKRKLNSQQLEIMRVLAYGASAIRFWGLTNEGEVRNFKPGPLRNHIDLKANLDQLTQDFEGVLTKYAQNTLARFPGRSSGQGKFWRLPPANLEQLKELVAAKDTRYNVSSYTTTFTIPAPHTSAAKNDLPENQRLFFDSFNVRVQQMRVWLPGATVDPASNAATGDKRRPLTAQILHTGSETLIDTRQKPHSYIHDIVRFGFEYDTTNVQSVKDCTADKVYDSQEVLQTTYDGQGRNPSATTYAPIGPFAQFTISLDVGANPGLNLTGVQDAYIEFQGWYNAGST